MLFNEGHISKEVHEALKDQTTVLPLVERMGKQGDVLMPDAALEIGIAHLMSFTQIAKGNAIVMFLLNLVVYLPAIHPANGDVTIILPSDIKPNKQFIIKDVSLEFGKVSSFDIHIKVASTVKIEQYSHGSIVAKLGGKYTIKTSGGSVSFRYFYPSIPGCTPTWVIENQFIGNPRTYPDQGFTMTHTGEIIRQNIFKRGQRK